MTMTATEWDAKYQAMVERSRLFNEATQLCETIQVWGDHREWVRCDLCHKLIAADPATLDTRPELAEFMRKPGITGCHQFLNRPAANVFEEMFEAVSHPTFCAECLERVRAAGVTVCECGCGG